MKNHDSPSMFNMKPGGESISDYMNRTDGNFKDYESALLIYRQNLAEEKGLSVEELHQSKSTFETTKKVADIALQHLSEREV